MIDYFQEGGWAMWPILFLTLLGLLGSGVAVLVARGPMGIAVGAGITLLAAMTLAAGVLGWQLGRAQTDDAIGYAAAADAERLRQAGYEEASHPLVFGALGAAIPGLCGMATLVLAISRRSQTAPGSSRREG